MKKGFKEMAMHDRGLRLRGECMRKWRKQAPGPRPARARPVRRRAA